MNGQVTLDRAMNDHSGHSKARVKKVTAQVNLYLFLNALLLSALFGA